MADGKDFLHRITRDEFEELASELFAKCILPVNKAMKDADMAMDEINDVVMVGGSSRMPKLKQILLDEFGEEININDTHNPDEVVALGATFLAR